MDPIDVVVNLGLGMGAIVVTGLMALVGTKFGTEIYSNIKQTLLERESVGEVQSASGKP